MNVARDWWRGDITWRTRLFTPLAWAYGGLVAARALAFKAGLLRASRLPVPVVVVGNIVAGGTGKTPLVVHLVRALAERGYRPGVISRGYGGHATDVREVAPDSDPAAVGDEPLLIRRRAACPVVIGRDRVAAGRALLAAHPDTDVLIADDGLQHLRLARDVEIALFDDRLAGNGRMMPAGPLREPMARLDRVDAVVVNGQADFREGAWRMRLLPEAIRPLAGGPGVPAAHVQNTYRGRIAAVAGIGNPARFFTLLSAMGIKAARHAFPDHHAFSRADLAAINADIVLMTEKDALKCENFGDPRLWVVPVTVRVDAGLVDKILETLRGSQTARHPGLSHHQGSAQVRP
jgi:tetraacyldisaccharide 4'-kinase